MSASIMHSRVFAMDTFPGIIFSQLSRCSPKSDRLSTPPVARLLPIPSMVGKSGKGSHSLPLLGQRTQMLEAVHTDDGLSEEAPTTHRRRMHILGVH